MMLSARVGAIEFDDREVRLAVVKTGGRLPVLIERHAEPVEYEEASARTDAYVRAVEALVGRVKSKPAAYVLCASARQAVVRAITVPFKGTRRVSSAVRFELEPYLAFPIEDLSVDHSVIRDVEGGTQVLAVGVRRNGLEEQLSVLNAAGIDPEGIALDASGLLGLWQTGKRLGPGLHAVLHVREKCSILAVLCGKALAFIRHLPVTVAQMHENPAAAAREVQNSLRAFQVAWEGGDELVGLGVTGVNLFEEELRLFEENFRVPVVFEDLGAKVKGLAQARGAAETPSGEGNRWEALAGAALNAAGNQPYAYNFRQGDLAQPQAVGGLIRHAAFSLVIGSIALLGTLFYIFLDYRASNEEIKQAGDEMWQIFYETFPDSPRAKEGPPPADIGGQLTFQFMQEAYGETTGKGPGISLDLFAQPTPLAILEEVSRSMSGKDVTLTRFQVEPPMAQRVTRVTIEGIAASPEVFNQVYSSLTQSKVLTVEPNPTQESAEGAKLKFTINATLAGNEQGNDGVQT